MEGDFETVCAAIQEFIPVGRNPSGKFDLGEYVGYNGQAIKGMGQNLIRDFEDSQREALYEKTQGRISEEITLERDET